MLSAFSTVVLRKMMALDKTSKDSLVGRLCLAEKVPLKDHASLLPLAIAHRTSLLALLKKKRTLRARYRAFGNALENKDHDLVRKFDEVIETQNFLDKNPPSESTVERVSRVLDQDWQGDQRQVDIIAQGEEHGLTDALLDQGFEAVWPKVSSGIFDGNISTGRHGLLEDLEKQVTMQKARLQQWKEYKSDIEQRKQTRGENAKTTPARQPFGSTTSHRYEQRKEKDLVFSPRKSPRESIWPAGSPTGPSNPEDPRPSATNEDIVHSTPPLTADISIDEVNSPLAAKSSEISKPASKDLLSRSSFDGENDDSGFSEVSTGGYGIKATEASSYPHEQIHSSAEHDMVPYRLQDCIGDRDPEIEMSDIGATSLAQNNNQDSMSTPEKPLADNLSAAPLVSFTINAGPTSLKPKLSLIERTRQSMAFASPSGNLSRDESPPILHTPLPPNPALEDADAKATLAQRARKSISLVPAKPKRSRDSIHARRSSKIYPTNQFETPRRPIMVHKMTPPDELMSPGAGYDSVFKSRPKVALSPTTSPVPAAKPDDESGVDRSQTVGKLEVCQLLDSQQGLNWEDNGDSSMCRLAYVNNLERGF